MFYAISIALNDPCVSKGLTSKEYYLLVSDIYNILTEQDRMTMVQYSGRAGELKIWSI